jgi:hypothetical protein
MKRLPTCIIVGAALLGSPAAALAAFADLAVARGIDTTGGAGGLVLADLDNDGFVDALVNTSVDTVAGRSRLYFWDVAAGSYVDRTATHAAGMTATVATRQAFAADLNNDGHLDLVRTAFGFIEVYFNRGPDATPAYGFGDAAGLPDFSFSDLDLALFSTEGAAAIDFNNDGWLDIVLDMQDLGVGMFQNPADGSANFSLAVGTGLPASGMAQDYLAVGDLNGDRLVDLVSRRDVGADIFFNNGNGSFTASTAFDMTAPNDNKGGVALCDFDDDGDLDMFWSDGGAGTGAANQVFENDGQGSFTPTGVPATLPAMPEIDGVACGDVDNDGDLDILLTDVAGGLLYINDTSAGNWSFTQDNRGINNTGNGEACSLADVDRDGDLDALINQAGDNPLFVNDLDDKNYLMVRVLTEVAGCPNPPVYRDDIGASARLHDAAGAPLSGVRAINGGRGHGSQDPLWLHFGLGAGGPDATYQVRVRPYAGDPPEAVVSVVPSSLGAYQLLTIDGRDGRAERRRRR